MTENVPETLLKPTALAARSDGREPRKRRARSNITGERANTLPAIIPGEKILKIVPDNVTLRAWGRRHGFTVKDRGKIPGGVRDAFMKVNGAWTVKIVSVMPPGDTEYRQFYQVRQGAYLRKMTRDPFYVRRELCDELYALLQEVTLSDTSGDALPAQGRSAKGKTKK